MNAPSRISHISRPRRIGRLGWFVLMMIGVGLVVVLFSIKTRALEARAKMTQLEHIVQQERAEVRMISAEIAHLENPERLSRLSKEYLGLHPVKAKQTLSLAQAVEQIPLRPKNERPESEPVVGEGAP
ncbi:MAG: hypothetical protein COA69_08880 [Robiginitomaculum sp.]|nr:MAG: hypothetical protein COA69_08880 [Robiginitomaculum sp.]